MSTTTFTQKATVINLPSATKLWRLLAISTLLIANLVFTPAIFAQPPAVHFDASTLALTNGTVVSSWGGQTSGGTPTYLTGQTPIGKPAVQFNGGGDQMGNNVSLPASAAGDWILVAVIKPQNIGAYHNLADDDPQVRPMLWIDPSFSYELNFGGGGGARVAGTGTNGWDIVIADSRLNQLYVNSPTPNATGGGAVAYPFTKFYDYFHRDFAQTFRGLVAEMRLYNNRSDFGGDFAALYNEMRTKWIQCAGPTITCPAPVTVNNTAGQCGANVSFAATATGTSPTITYSHASGSFFPVGMTTVTATATNACGNVNCSFTVTVIDNQAPTISCAPNVTINNTPGLCTGTTTLTAPTVSDNCNRVGNALNFDGINDFVDAGNISSANFGTGNFTVEFWIKTNTAPAANSDIVSKRTICNASNFWNIKLKNNGRIFYEAIQDASFTNYAYLETTSSVVDGQWHHLAVTRSNGLVSIYIDGALNSSATLSNTNLTNSDPVRIGKGACSDFPYGGYFKGDLDEVRIWNNARSSTDIVLNMNSEAAPQSGLIAVYHFNQGVGGGNNTSPAINTAIDASGNNNNGSLTNFALNGATSNWVAGRVAVTNNAPATYPIGNTTVTWTATDAAGNTNTCSQIVTVTDNQPPVITCPANTIIDYGDDESPTTNGTGTATATDNCAGVSVGTPSDATANVLGNNKTITRTWTATDASNNTATCNQTITVCDLGVSLGNNRYVFFGITGLPGTSGVITATPSGGLTGITYTWTATAGSFAVNGSGESITPSGYIDAQTITYTVTATAPNGCTATASVTITYFNINCSNNGNTVKVKVCHIPQGNPTNCNTICVSINAYQTLLDDGSYLGNCLPNCAIPPQNRGDVVNIDDYIVKPDVKGVDKLEDGLFNVKVFNNPTSATFILKVSGAVKDKVSIRIMNNAGVLVEQRANLNAGQEIRIGDNYISGTYFAEVMQGTNRKVVKLVKLN